MFIDDFLEFEAESGIVNYRCEYKDIILWAYIKPSIMFQIEEHIYGADAMPVLEKQVHPWDDYIRYNTFRLPKCDILYMTTSDRFIEEREQEIRSKIEGDYIGISGKSVADCLIHTSNFDYDKYKQVPFVTNDFITRLIFMEAKKNSISPKDQATIDAMMNCLRKELPIKLTEGVYVGIKKMLETYVASFPAYYKYYYKLMDIVQPKVVFCNCAVFGKPEIRVMNDYGVITAEFQHGYFRRNHFGYSYSEKLAEDKEYRKHMPQYLLTFHDFWTKNINIPSNIYRVGNPIVEKNIRRSEKSRIELDKNNILLIPCYDAADYKEFISDLLERFPDKYSITVKVHPGRAGDVKAYQEMFNTPRVSATAQGSVYDCIHKAQYIIGDCSTAMYEAAAVGKSVFVIDKKVSQAKTPSDFGIWIKDAEEMFQYIQQHSDLNNEENIYFDLNWKENYHRFLRDIVGLSIES